MHLRAWRETQGINLEAAVDKTGLTGGYLSQLERGLKWPGAHVISVIKNWTNGAVTANDIFDNLDMSLFTVKPVRVGVRGGSKSTKNGVRNGKRKKGPARSKRQERRH